MWGAGAGQDVIDNTDASAGRTDTLAIDGVLLPADLAFVRSGNDLIVRLRGADDQVTVRNHFAGSAIDAVSFSNGTLWNALEINAHITNELSAGADIYTGSEGSDSIDGLAGNDTLSGMGGDDAIEGGDGNDALYGNEGNDALSGGAGVDALQGGNGNDLLSGGGGTDTLIGGGGADTLDGRGDGAADSLQGGADGDVYLFGRGSGADTITEAGDLLSTDVLRLDAGIAPGDVTARRSGNDLLLQINGTTDQITVSGALATGASALSKIERIEFADSTVWTETEIRQQVLLAAATAGNDTIAGFDGNDLIDGLAGNDTINASDGNDSLIGGQGADYLYGENGNDTLNGGVGGGLSAGGLGSDTYLFGRGYGSQIFDEEGENAGDIDTVVMGADILPGDIVLTRSKLIYSSTEYDQLGIGIRLSDGTLSADAITVWQYFARQDGYNKIERVVFADGTTWDATTITNLLDTGAAGNDTIFGDRWDSTIDGRGGNDTLYGNGGNDLVEGGGGNDVLYGGIGNDSLAGGTGADVMFGGVGNDTYRYSRGDGIDTINEALYQNGGGVDTLEFGSGIVAADIGLYRNGNDLFIVVDNSPNQIKVADFFTNASYQIERILFADRSEWNVAEIAARTVAGTQDAMTGTTGDDTFIVDNTLDTISEGASQGTDTVLSSVSYTLGANIENLTLTGVLNSNATGNSLDNLIVGNSSNNVLSSGGGYDILRGGQGDDTYFANGSVVIENAGEGVDTLYDSSSGSYSLTANVENLVLSSGYIYKTQFFGNAENNVIEVRYGDYVDGKAGDDTIVFRNGLGNWHYYNPTSQILGSTAYVDSVGDKVVIQDASEAARSRVISSADHYVLDDGVGTLELAYGSAARIGTGNSLDNSLQGNEFANTLYGLAGNDKFYGGAGNDTLIGGKGDDVYYLNPRLTVFSLGGYLYEGYSGSTMPAMDYDLVVEVANEGIDTVNTIFNYTLTANVENLVLGSYRITTGYGNYHDVYALQGTGNELNNLLTGNAGDNVLDGMSGADTMVGGDGSDTYYVDNVGDVIIENSGIDTVSSNISYSLASTLENLILTGSGNDTGTGNNANNRLDGSQSAATNQLIGGAGDDTYVLGAGDIAVELANEGVDTVITSDNYVLDSNLENLTLVGSDATSGAGNAGSNILDGSRNAASNILVGLAGDDTYVVDALDVIVEAVGGGIDTVVTTGASYTLGANLENLTIGSSVVLGNGVGNELNNVLTGNLYANRLDGGVGADTMRGGGGGDTYVVDDVGDVVEDSSGNATVETSILYAIGGGVKNLVLTGSSAISGAGNALSNVLDGSQNSAANQLTGGLGDDEYILGAGDTIVENLNEGNDSVRTASSYTLGATLENLRLQGAADVNATGNESDNFLEGNDGNNILDGASGVDAMYGRLGDDRYVVDNIADSVWENLSAGTDLVQSSVTYTLSANVENLTLTGSAAINATGNDLGNVLVGNGGANTLSGGAGNDTYVFRRGGGADMINNDDAGAGRVDTLVLEGLNVADIRLQKVNGNDLVFEILDTGESITVLGFFSSDSQKLDVIRFADGTVWNRAAMIGNIGIYGTSGNDSLAAPYNEDSRLYGYEGNDTLYGSTGNDRLDGGVDDDYLAAQAGNDFLDGGAGSDTLSGDDGNDTLDGGAGIDVLTGGGGNDTYIFRRGGEVDLINNYDPGVGRVDTLRLEGLNVADIRLEKWGDFDLAFVIKDTGESIKVMSFFSSDVQKLNAVIFSDGTLWNRAALLENFGVYGTVGNDFLSAVGDVDSRVYGYAGNDNLGGGSANDQLDGGADDDNLSGQAGNDFLDGGAGSDTLFGSEGNDTLDGGAGNDALTGDVGNDTYVFRRGGGTDTINNYDLEPGRVDTLRLEGLNVADIRLEARNGYDLAFVIGDTGESITVQGFFYDDQQKLDAVIFADGTLWNRAALLENFGVYGTLGNDNLSAVSDVDSRLYGYAGNDTLYGNTANDQLDGGADDDYLSAQIGNDTLDGGAGNDVLTGDAGNDTYVFRRGGGTDTINNYDLDLGRVDTLRLEGLNVADIQLEVRNGYDLAFVIKGTGESITVQNFFNDGYPLDAVTFADGTIWDQAAMLSNLGIYGTAGDDTLSASSGDSRLYGYAGNDTLNGAAGNDLLDGGEGNDILQGGAGADTLIGGAGNDICLVDNSGDIVTENIDEGTDLVQSSITYTLGTDLENLTLTGTAAINASGNAQNNILVGNSASNVLDGGAGADAMSGGAGNDTYVVDDAGDVVSEAASAGTDLVQSSITYMLGANLEKLTLTGNAAINGTGNTLANTLTGNSADNVLDGGAGADALSGGLGNDTYVVDNTGDVVSEAASAGTDLVQASVSHTLAANVENLTLTGIAAINGTGNTQNNILVGNSVANILNGGTGADTMRGGVGNDTYVIDNLGDIVVENASEGTDLVQSSLAYVLGADLENLTLTGTAAINATGNELNNTLTGNAGDNVLNGGIGADKLVGGAGNDTYYVSTGDTVTEAASAGTDTVISDIAWTLGSNLENMTLTGATAINGTGNTLNNRLIGNSAANVLSGGTGTDTMQGGAGNDTYVVDNVGDIVTENLGEGADLVKSSVTYTLSANVEDLTLTGTTAINATGNTLDNVLTGNSAANTLNGGLGNDTLSGAAGADTMLGGLGDDTYTVDNSLDVVTENLSEGIDRVNSSITLTLAAHVEVLALTGTSAINGTGNTLNNLVRGNTGSNTLNGGAGNDILEGGAGNDLLTDTAGTALFNGGAGTDTLTGGAGAEIFLGGLGNDTYTTGAGNDLILFNKGDGQDTFASGGTGSDTVSLGGGVTYADLSFSKATNDLVLKVGASDQITFKNWYATTPSKPVLTLQMMAEAMADFAPGGADPLRDQKVESFNFAALAGAFDTARVANPGLSSWALSNALLNFQLAGSDSAALGGDLAYQYGRNGTLAGIGVTPAFDVLNSAALGASAQTLSPLAGLQSGTQRLS